ncbi:TetR/AcrR family transcriptional regulator [Actinobacillus succinogenes]|uniref:TetR/AcrR family transcriptional regulator n=1 Tax=Actinobacillus succinogenes TaxID=67854 RepID=UPI001FE4DDEA|nr:TetR/AcrR family transcriptional regulator [Actinobacillus succinogenes]
MADRGLQNLSMQKIAKQAKISAGTIYLYFESKDKLLEQLARRVFTLFNQELEKNYDEDVSYFEQYRTMWWNVWHYLLNNPIQLKNMSQYWSLPTFIDICAELDQESHWAIFCQKAIAANEMCDLPIKVLFSLGLEHLVNLAKDKIYFKLELADDVLENIIERSWRSLKK